MTYRAGALVGAALLALAAPPVRAALPEELQDWDFSDAGIRFVLRGDALRERLRQAAAEATRGAIPPNLSELSLGPLKYRNQHVTVDRVELAPGADDRELTFQVIGGVDADRARLVVKGWALPRFEPDGNARTADLRLSGRLRLSVTASGAGHALATGQTLHVNSHLPLPSGPVDLQGRRLFERDLPLLELLGRSTPAGLRPTGLRVLDAAARDPVFELEIAVDAPEAPPAPPAPPAPKAAARTP